MTKQITLEFFVRSAAQLLAQHPDWRYGQAMFNAARKLMPEKAAELVNTDADCYYLDSRVPELMAALFPEEAVKANYNPPASKEEASD